MDFIVRREAGINCFRDRSIVLVGMWIVCRVDREGVGGRGGGRTAEGTGVGMEMHLGVRLGMPSETVLGTVLGM